MNKLQFFITLVIGIVIGVLATRFFYNAAIDIATLLMVAAVIVLFIVLFKIKRAVSKDN